MTNPSSQLSVIIIPCFNESKRFDFEQYSQDILASTGLKIVFVNDGSTDDTLAVLNALRDKFPTQVEVFNLLHNLGKAEAVRAGMLHQLNKKVEFNYIGYLDADLSTSIEEWLDITQFLSLHPELVFAFGSRISKVGSMIDRKMYRHLIGRIIATFISNILRLRVYDTQCGAKVFSKSVVEFVFEKPFISKWLFDVEIFARVLSDGSSYNEKNMIEYPLKKWIDKVGSKVKVSYVFKLFIDLWRINRTYPDLKKRTMQ